jgi:uncharacterized membrane protein
MKTIEPETQDSEDAGQSPTVSAGSRGHKAWSAVLWVITAVAVVLALLLPLNGQSAAGTVLLLFVAFSLIHGIRRYGAKALLVFLVETLVVSNFFENLSINTGFPFGHYHYTGSPKLIDVPIQIGPIYFGLGYACWLVASTLLGAADARLGLRAGRGRRINVMALPMLAAAMMAVYDLGTDSIASTVSKDWVWEHGGGVFGVPFTNYLGWWLTTYLFFQIFALYLARSRTPVHTVGGRGALLQPVLLYASLGLTSVTYFIAATSSTVTDATGVVWNEHALNETMMTINIFGVVLVAFLALVKLASGDPAPVRRL